jgi:hypothetical protein
VEGSFETVDKRRSQNRCLLGGRGGGARGLWVARGISLVCEDPVDPLVPRVGCRMRVHVHHARTRVCTPAHVLACMLISTGLDWTGLDWTVDHAARLCCLCAGPGWTDTMRPHLCARCRKVETVRSVCSLDQVRRVATGAGYRSMLSASAVGGCGLRPRTETVLFNEKTRTPRVAPVRLHFTDVEVLLFEGPAQNHGRDAMHLKPTAIRDNLMCVPVVRTATTLIPCLCAIVQQSAQPDNGFVLASPRSFHSTLGVARGSIFATALRYFRSLVARQCATNSHSVFGCMRSLVARQCATNSHSAPISVASIALVEPSTFLFLLSLFLFWPTFPQCV